MMTQRAICGETVSATSAAGTIAMSGPKFGMKFNNHAMNAKSNAYGTPRAASQIPVETKTISMAIS